MSVGLPRNHEKHERPTRGKAMTRDYILWNLREAEEELSRTIREVESDQAYSDAEFIVAMTHLYHHLNTAWNAREAAPERVAKCTQDDFRAWRQFPADLDMALDVE
jgi:hypothetical protein